ncbi:hypothetical protein [Streptomyces sp. NPDC059165]|uniref:hypothetical protein n=1 Tax=Streptomyces sp. NPDC059165 TaxID=3346751 RepID=UPI0036749FEA
MTEALIDVRAHEAPAEDTWHSGGQAVVIVCRHRCTCELSFYRCHSTTPSASPTSWTSSAPDGRSKRTSKAPRATPDLDQGQVTCCNSWMRWSLIGLPAAAVLAVAHSRGCSREFGAADAELFPAGLQELLAIRRVVVIPAPRRDLEHVLFWCAWRRHHQHK